MKNKASFINKTRCVSKKKGLVTLVLLAAIYWQISNVRDLNRIENKTYAYTVEETRRLIDFPEAQYDYGQKAWHENRLEDAKKHLIQAVSLNNLDVDAWLKLAHTEFVLGNRNNAIRILAFTDQLTRDIIRWKWKHILLARDLGLKDIFLKNINAVIPCKTLWTDALQLMDRHYNRNTAVVLTVMAQTNKPAYLKWLMRWKRTEDTWTVWNSLQEELKRKGELYEQYVNYLIRHSAYKKAASVWKAQTGTAGMTNPGFEKKLSKNGFGWNYRSGENQNWELARLPLTPRSGRYALKISFKGSENIHFNHFWQIVPVEPAQDYLLSYWCKSHNLTTDKRPFIDIRCYGNTNDRQWQGSMMPENSDWHVESIRFTPPEQCFAARIQLIRQPSHRFNSMISGDIWLDDFNLTPAANSSRSNTYQE